MSVETDNRIIVTIPVSRGRAWERAALRIGPGVVTAFLSAHALGRLNFAPSGISNRITDYALAMILVPIALVGLALVVFGLRWLLMSMWFGKLEIVGTEDALTFRLGPLGAQRYTLEELTVYYPFEFCPEEELEGVYESLLDPAVQMEEYLPHIVRRRDSARLDPRIPGLAALREKQCAALLRPWTNAVRNKRNGSSSMQMMNDDQRRVSVRF